MTFRSFFGIAFGILFAVLVYWAYNEINLGNSPWEFLLNIGFGIFFSGLMACCFVDAFIEIRSKLSKSENS